MPRLFYTFFITLLVFSCNKVENETLNELQF